MNEYKIRNLEKSRTWFLDNIQRHQGELNSSLKLIALAFVVSAIGIIGMYYSLKAGNTKGFIASLSIGMCGFIFVPGSLVWLGWYLLGWHSEQGEIRYLKRKIAEIDAQLRELNPVCSNSTAQCQHKPTCVPL